MFLYAFIADFHNCTHHFIYLIKSILVAIMSCTQMFLHHPHLVYSCFSSFRLVYLHQCFRLKQPIVSKA